MDNLESRSAQKRRAKDVEKLAAELIALSPGVIAGLPCEPTLRQEITRAKKLKGGAYKRQMKFIAKALRQCDVSPVFEYLEEKRGSQLKKNQDFHELEELREAVLSEAIQYYKENREQNSPVEEALIKSATLLKKRFPDLDMTAVGSAAHRYARTRKPVFSREIFRSLKAAHERQQFSQQHEDPNGL